VLVVVSDKKIPICADSMVLSYTADVVSANDYSPFGAPMAGRSYTAPNSDYRYGFNGKENDNEVKGLGNQQDYGMRISDTRLGRFLSVDPITQNYPELTPYQFASNRPIDNIDLDGGEWKSKHKWTDVITDKSQIKLLGAKYLVGMTYEEAWRAMAPEILRKSIGKKIDCADLAIDAIVEFAFTYKLSIHFEDYKAEDKDPTFDNDNYGFTKKNSAEVKFKEGEWQRLADNIKASYGAGDIYNNNKIATTKSLDDVQAGDVVSWKHPDNGGYHAQTISKVDRLTFGFNTYETIQGNLESGKAQPARKTEYKFIEVKNRKGETLLGREWNFENFDKNGKK
jgi:RHS repeat-associated protein